MVPDRDHLGLATERSPTAFDRILYDVQNDFAPERLGQEFEGSCLHRLNRGRYIAVASNENDGHIDPIHHSFLHIETAQVRKLNIQNQTARSRDSRTSQEIFGRSESLSSPTGATD